MHVSIYTSNAHAPHHACPHTYRYSSLTGHTELSHAQQAVTRRDLVAEAQTDLRRGEGHARGVVIQQTSTHTYQQTDRQIEGQTHR